MNEHKKSLKMTDWDKKYILAELEDFDGYMLDGHIKGITYVDKEYTEPSIHGAWKFRKEFYTEDRHPCKEEDRWFTLGKYYDKNGKYITSEVIYSSRSGVKYQLM